MEKVSLKQQDSALVRKLVAARVPLGRARQLDNMVAATRATLAENVYLRNMGTVDHLPVFALMLGEMLAVNAAFCDRLDPDSLDLWVKNPDVIRMITVAQQPDPNPPPKPTLAGALKGMGLTVLGDQQLQEHDLIAEEAADMAEAAGQSVQRMGKA